MIRRLLPCVTTLAAAAVLTLGAATPADAEPAPAACKSPAAPHQETFLRRHPDLAPRMIEPAMRWVFLKLLAADLSLADQRCWALEQIASADKAWSYRRPRSFDATFSEVAAAQEPRNVADTLADLGGDLLLRLALCEGHQPAAKDLLALLRQPERLTLAAEEEGVLYWRLEQAGELPAALKDRYALLFPQIPVAVRLALHRGDGGSFSPTSPWAWRCIRPPDIAR